MRRICQNRPKCPRLCENVHEPRMPRIVFSIAFFRQKLSVQLVSTSTKSRWKFYTQVRRRSFHTAWTDPNRTSKLAKHSQVSRFDRTANHAYRATGLVLPAAELHAET